MAMTAEEYLNALRQQKVKPIEQAWQKAKDALSNQQTELQQQQAAELPQYDVRKNQEDQSGWRQQQALMRRAQATGNTSTGQLDSNMSMINNSVMNNKFGVDTEKQRYVQGMVNRMNQVKQGMAQNDMEKESNMAGLEGEIASKRYEMEQAQKAAASRARASGAAKSPSATEVKNQTTSAIYDWVNNAASQGMSEQDAMNYAYENASEYAQYGVSPQDVLKYIQQYYTQYRNPKRFTAGGYQPV